MANLERVTVGQQLRRVGNILRSNRVFDTYIAARASLGLAAIALPFYGVYAKTVLGAPEAMVGVYVGVRVGASLASNLLWGRLSDRRGNRLVMRIASLGRGLAVLLAITLVLIVDAAKLRGSWLPYLALPLFFLEGATTPAAMLVGSNFLIEFVPEGERPIYLGLSSTLVGTVLLLTLGGGLLVDLLGYLGLFAASLALYALAYALATALPEPREAPAGPDTDRPAR
jgi:MFS family permease